MDTSPEYIKQCEKAKEIQLYRNGHKKDGDFYYFPRFKETHALSGFPPATQESFIWLPRQDQLQEIVGGLEKGFIDWQNWLGNVYGYNYGGKPNGHLRIFTSFEQLWLAFVMKEKFNKVWDGTDWK